MGKSRAVVINGTEINTVPCRACGCPMLWTINDETGARIPLDARAPVYRVILDERTGAMKIDERVEGVFVSHFATCPKASSFSRSGRQS